ncbi:efflux RND transporter periplasmic adaptor subunit [Thioclava sp. 'Guangxiensis']|uniref:efflux RND transporter periplasmic adaptor subunit n=1 Tax=Thioclava sp. 'Guangxiensis' TaxID=3149044 RepID=UPI0038779494
MSKNIIFLSRPITVPMTALGLVLGLAVSAPLTVFTSSPASAQQAQQGPKQVGVITVAESDVPYIVTLPGRAVAYEQADIRPRVEGMITAIPYKRGALVKKGTVLFEIEPDTYEAELAAAQAAVDSAQAAEQTAQSTFNRYDKIRSVGVTQTELEDARSSLASAKADVKSAQASLQTAQLNLDRTHVESPIDGVVEVPETSVGSLVTANQTDALTTVTRLDPIYVDVSESSAQMQRTKDMIAAGTLKTSDDVKAQVTLETGDVYPRDGKLVAPSAVVSDTTGTVDYRVQFDNPDAKMLPGQFLRVTMTLGTTKAILIPQNATTRKSDGTLTAFIASDENKAEQVTLSTNGSYNNQWIVTSGLKDGDKLIVDGLMNLQNEAEIETVPVTINDEGVVEDAQTDGSDASGKASE